MPLLKALFCTTTHTLAKGLEECSELSPLMHVSRLSSIFPRFSNLMDRAQLITVYSMSKCAKTRPECFSLPPPVEWLFYPNACLISLVNWSVLTQFLTEVFKWGEFQAKICFTFCHPVVSLGGLTAAFPPKVFLPPLWLVRLGQISIHGKTSAPGEARTLLHLALSFPAADAALWQMAQYYWILKSKQKGSQC